MENTREHKKNINNQAIYGVVHGGILPDYRKMSCEILSKNDFDGFAIGGSLGVNINDIVDVLNSTIKHLEEEKQRIEAQKRVT
mgnify:CR=1 FL=1